MNPHHLRATALDRAITWAATFGVDCPHCIMAMAIHFAEFIETGDVTGMVDDEDDDQPVITFTPDDRTVN